jgi:hypothetical protein
MIQDFRKNKVVIRWVIPTFDRTKQEPLPFDNRHYVLDLSTVGQGLAEEIYNSLSRGKSREFRSAHQLASNESTVTIDVAPPPPNFAFLKYRPLFKQCTTDEVQAMLDDKTAETLETLGPGLGADYIEDENGNGITMQQVFEHLQPGSQAIIRFDVESVLEIGPVEPRDPQSWTSLTANTISHFLYVVEKIAASRWYRSPQSLTFLQSIKSSNAILEYVGADRTSTLEILLFVRQLYSSDELFNNAAKLYMRHLSHDGKRWWVKDIKNLFNQSRADEHKMPAIEGFDRRSLIDTFLYGAGIMHAAAQKDAQNDLTNLLAKYSKEHFMMTVLSSMRDLVNYAIMLYHPMKQDFTHWILSCGMSTPDRPNVDLLFADKV